MAKSMRTESVTVKDGTKPGINGKLSEHNVLQSLDLDRLLKLRLVVARFGEMDIAKWWNTKGQLGRLGAMALRRGFPRTHNFAQARSVFAAAAHRCAEVFNPPDCVTLWRLPEVIEEAFDTRWEHWLDHAADWQPFFQELETVSTNRSDQGVQHGPYRI